MHEVLLDRAGDAPVPPTYRLIVSEVQFLNHALDVTELLIRGEHLCSWAEAFYQGRGIRTRETASPTRELQSLCPDLTVDQCVEIYQRSAARFAELPRPLTISSVLQALHPDTIWMREPSLEHAADWLLWLVVHKPDAATIPLLASICRIWEQGATGAERHIYSVTDDQEAWRWLDSWLGIIAKLPDADLGEYIFTITPEMEERAQQLWRRQIVETKGAFFVDLQKRSVPYQLRRLAALETVRYLEVHSEQLSRERFEQLTPYLNWHEQSELQQLLPPPIPGPLPDQPEQILRWFRHEYLPFRVWQATNQIEDESTRVAQAAQQFAHWYLEQYPRALMGNAMRELLSFRQPLAFKDTSYVTLAIVLDGLHVADAQQLRQEIQKAAPRLAIVEERLVFAPLPTVTEFAKEALLRGVPPLHAQEIAAVGDIIPESEEPTRRLKRSNGGLYFWRVQEPDRTYHQRNGSGTLVRDVESELIAVAKKIGDLVRDLPSKIQLRVVIATDHGRLLGTSHRTLKVPFEMTSHGRAAWSTLSGSGLEYPESGYLLEDGIAYLHGQRFGLPVDAAIAISEDAFETNDGKKGAEAYSHGGLYPEEVIVPWMVMVRDMVAPDLTITLSGNGQAGRQSSVTVKIINYADIDFIVKEIVLKFPAIERHYSVDKTVQQRSSENFEIALDPWPTATDAKNALASTLVMLSNGTTFEVDTSVNLQSEEMYLRENILGDLEL